MIIKYTQYENRYKKNLINYTTVIKTILRIRRLFKIKYLIKIKVINKNFTSPEFLTNFLNRFNLV